MATIHGQTGALTVACGGAEPLLVVASGGDREIRELEEAGGFPVGIVPDTVYEEISLVLHPGETLVMVSDGVTEARNARRELLGIDGWKQSVGQSVRSHPVLRDAANAAWKTVTDYVVGNRDDMCGLWARKE